MAKKLKLYIELSDGSSIVGSFISIAREASFPECVDKPISAWSITIMSDTLGKLDINAVYVIGIGTDPNDMTHPKNPVDVALYVNNLLQLAHSMPLDFLQPRE